MKKCHKHRRIRSVPASGLSFCLITNQLRCSGRTEKLERTCTQWFWRDNSPATAFHLPHANNDTNSSSQWYRRMKSLQETLDGPETRGGTEAQGGKRERYQFRPGETGSVDLAAHSGPAQVPCVVFLLLSSLVWLLARILISGGSGLWPTREALRAFRYCRRVTCNTQHV